MRRVKTDIVMCTRRCCGWNCGANVGWRYTRHGSGVDQRGKLPLSVDIGPPSPHRAGAANWWLARTRHADQNRFSGTWREPGECSGLARGVELREHLSGLHVLRIIMAGLGEWTRSRVRHFKWLLCSLFTESNTSTRISSMNDSFCCNSTSSPYPRLSQEQP